MGWYMVRVFGVRFIELLEMKSMKSKYIVARVFALLELVQLRESVDSLAKE